jgi:hypothetical protein
MDNGTTEIRFSSLWAALLLAISLCGGCASSGINANLASWQGSHIDEVSSAWGEPRECIESGEQTVCAWGGRIDPEPAVQALQPRPACLKVLAVDNSGHITGWGWRGNRCPDSSTLARAE